MIEQFESRHIEYWIVRIFRGSKIHLWIVYSIRFVKLDISQKERNESCLFFRYKNEFYLGSSFPLRSDHPNSRIFERWESIELEDLPVSPRTGVAPWRAGWATSASRKDENRLPPFTIAIGNVRFRPVSYRLRFRFDYCRSPSESAYYIESKFRLYIDPANSDRKFAFHLLPSHWELSFYRLEYPLLTNHR